LGISHELTRVRGFLFIGKDFVFVIKITNGGAMGEICVRVTLKFPVKEVRKFRSAALSCVYLLKEFQKVEAISQLILPISEDIFTC